MPVDGMAYGCCRCVRALSWLGAWDMRLHGHIQPPGCPDAALKPECGLAISGMSCNGDNGAKRGLDNSHKCCMTRRQQKEGTRYRSCLRQMKEEAG